MGYCRFMDARGLIAKFCLLDETEDCHAIFLAAGQIAHTPFTVRDLQDRDILGGPRTENDVH